MGRHEVYRHPEAGQRKGMPDLLDLQNNCISAVDTRVVAPLRPAETFARHPLRFLLT
jgi:toxin CcdB